MYKRQGDLICKVGGTDVNEMGYSEAVNAIRGESVTSVTFTVKRGEEHIDFTIIRQEYTDISVQSKMIGNICLLYTSNIFVMRLKYFYAFAFTNSRL